MRDVYIIGADTIKFGKYINNTISQLAAKTVFPCLTDAGIDKEDIQAVYFANSAWGEYRRQVCIRGQVALRPLGIENIPITNVENACAGGSTAFHHAWLGVASGLYDVTMALGVEKIYDSNQHLVFSSFLTGLDVGNILPMMESATALGMTEDDIVKMKQHLEKYSSIAKKTRKNKKSINARVKDIRDSFVVALRIGETMGYDVLKSIRKMSNGDHSPFMDLYGNEARKHMKEFGTTIEQFAVIASKNHFHSTMNPNAQYQFPLTVEQVLADRMVTWPLTRAMCAPVGDGAASAVLCDEKTVKRLGLMSKAVKVRASIIGSGKTRENGEPDIGARLAALAYKKAGLGPKDINLAEVHDASAYGELHQTENMGFCKPGEGGLLAMSGATKLGGRIPVNTSGGLESRGHPIGASGLGQLHEIVTQLRGNAGSRQVKGARIGLAENGGGAIGDEEAAMCIHILEAPLKKSGK